MIYIGQPIMLSKKIRLNMKYFNAKKKGVYPLKLLLYTWIQIREKYKKKEKEDKHICMVSFLFTTRLKTFWLRYTI